MTTVTPGSTADSRAAALALFEGHVPCFFSLTDPPCPEAAGHLAYLVHEESTANCTDADPWPVCDEHKRAMQMVSHPFWRTWHQMTPTRCHKCGTSLRVKRFEAL